MLDLVKNTFREFLNLSLGTPKLKIGPMGKKSNFKNDFPVLENHKRGYQMSRNQGIRILSNTIYVIIGLRIGLELVYSTALNPLESYFTETRSS